jgi:hypothetical protein
METEGMRIEPRYFPHGSGGTDEADDYIQKRYKYYLVLEGNTPCAPLLRRYLHANMKNGGEAELWSIWLGTGMKAYYQYRPHVKNIGADEYGDIADAMDDYIESLPAVIKKRRVTIDELDEDDLLFFNQNYYACVSIIK